MKKRLVGIFYLLVVFIGVAFAQEPPKTEWDVLKPSFPLSTVSIDTDETTWSSLDVTPDGKRFFFDMLGDIYVVEIEFIDGSKKLYKGDVTIYR